MQDYTKGLGLKPAKSSRFAVVMKWVTIAALLAAFVTVAFLWGGCVVYPSPYYYDGGVHTTGPYEPVYGSWGGGHGGGHGGHGGRR